MIQLMLHILWGTSIPCCFYFPIPLSLDGSNWAFACCVWRRACYRHAMASDSLHAAYWMFLLFSPSLSCAFRRQPCRRWVLSTLSSPPQFPYLFPFLFLIFKYKVRSGKYSDFFFKRCVKKKIKKTAVIYHLQ